MGTNSPEKGLYLKRNKNAGRINYDLRKQWYESTGVKEEYKGKAKLSHVVDPNLKSFDLKLVCEMLKWLVQELEVSKKHLELHDEWVMDEREWEGIYSRVHEETPLLLADFLLKFEGEKKNDVLRRVLEKAIHDIGWKERRANGLEVIEKKKKNKFSIKNLFEILSVDELSDILSEKYSEEDSLSESLLKDLFKAVDRIPDFRLGDSSANELKIDKKGRITIPREVRKNWGIEEGDEKVPLKRTSGGVEFKLRNVEKGERTFDNRGLYTPDEDIKNPRGEVNRLIRFFNSLYFHLVEESSIKIKEINYLQKDIGRWLDIYGRLSEDEKIILFSTFSKSPPVRFVLKVSRRFGERLAEKWNSGNPLLDCFVGFYLVLLLLKRGGQSPT